TVAQISALITNLRQGEIDKYSIGSILGAIAPRENSVDVARRIGEVAKGLPETRQARKEQEAHFKKLKQQGEFSRSIIRCAGSSAFVVDEFGPKETAKYLILTNTHVAGTKKYVTRRATGRRLINQAEVLIRHQDVDTDTEDVAMLAIEKTEVEKDLGAGEKLVRINMTPDFKEGELATLVSGAKNTISTGHLISLGNRVILLGAKSKGGDSGSPYLIKTKTGFSAVAVHARQGPIGMLLSPQVQVPDGENSSPFIIVT
ncbi:unnamed protein product, partial [marine sediment metagenome]